MFRILLVLFAACVFSLPVRAGEYPMNEVPMYGGIEKTPALLQADEHLISDIEAKGYTREQGAVLFAKRGWDFFRKGDMSTAIKRFNQAWLLDGDNYQAYWGFALVYLLRDADIENADRMFVKALSLEPDAGNFYMEYGRFTAENKSENPEEAIALFQKGLAIAPRIRDGYVGLILSYDEKKDVESAYYWYRQGKTHGVFSADEVKQFESMFQDTGIQ
ncbi:tetratricopeptide repeat protein [Pseudodesulfovibrio portus]|uniref:Tetratricopeptide repeat protein n=1 Tax=Pseudodesulfovibrio portus TaxID=231439 RepID=A0ABN6S028_9BACT|nr:hypothetical protein [Pseudodesulfovibrio portus]BDQ35398.1 hypothetical protein JCM14722_29400 [Pseudodesulfovibrio portus]